MQETRIYNKITDINSDDVKEFYEKKSKANLLNAVFLNDRLDTKSHNLRNEKEKEELISFLDNKKYNVLDIGCGGGRFVDNIFNYIEKYDGIDFCSNFINLAHKKYKNFKNINFYLLKAPDLDLNLLKPPYNLIIMCGICMYMNDDDLSILYGTINKLINKGAKIYLQETISTINQRLTLKNFYSDELKTNYSAIYRTQEEYINLINSSFENLKLIKKECILTKQTGLRKETNSCCFCFERV